MSEVIIVYQGPRGPQGPSGGGGGSGGSLTVENADTTISDVSRLTIGDGLSLQEGIEGEARIAVDAAGTANSAAVWGSTLGLVYGTTDQTVQLKDILASSPVGSTTRPYSPTGQPLRLNGRVRVPSGRTLDLSQIDVTLGKYGEVAIQGGFTELPTTNLFRLRTAAEPGDDVIEVDTTPQGSDMSLLPVGGWIILRGMNDGASNALQRHEARITARDVTLGAETITIDPPIPDDQGTFLVSYPNGDYFNSTGNVDRSYITAKVGQALEADVLEGQDFVQVPTPASFPEGSIVQLFDTYKAGDIGGSSNSSIRDETLRVRSVDGDYVYFHKAIERDYLTSRSATLFKITPVSEAHIIGARRISLVETPDADPAPRRHYYQIAYGERCTIRDPKVNEMEAGFCHRGQAGRLYRSIDCKIVGGYRIGPADAVTKGVSGDLYGFADYYSSDCVISGVYTERCRHGRVWQGSTRPTIEGGRGVNDLINSVDLHGLWSVGGTIRDVRIELGRDFASDATTKSGIVLGNTTHYGGDHRVTVRDVEIVAPPEVANTRGLTIRAGCTGIELTRGVRVSGTEIGADIQRNSRKPDLETTDVDLGGLLVEDSVAEAIRISGNAPAWATATAYTASTSSPAWVENDGNVYKATTGGTSGGTPPTHTTGTVSDGGINWLFVTDTPYVPIKRIKLDGAKVRGCGIQVQARRVDDLRAYDVRVSEPAQPVVDSSGLLNPGFMGTEITGLAIERSNISGTAGGVVLADCPAAFISKNTFDDMEYGEAYFTDLGGNDGTELNDNKYRGSSLGIDNSGGSSLNITGPSTGGTAGVATFNGRDGTVVPTSGDYTAAQISETGSHKIMTSAERTKLAALSTALQLPDPSAQTDGKVLTVATGAAVWATPSGGGGSGDVTGAENLSVTDAGAFFKDKVAGSLRFRQLVFSGDIATIINNPNTVDVSIRNASTTGAGLMSAADKTALAAAVSFPVRVDQAQGVLVIGPSTWSTDLGSGLNTTTAVIYSYASVPAGNPRWALTLVAAAADGDFLQCLNADKKQAFVVYSNSSNQTEVRLHEKGGSADCRVSLSEGGIRVGPTCTTESFGAGEVMVVKGGLRVTGAISGPTAGGSYSSPLVIGKARIWDDGTSKLRAKYNADPTSATDGTVIW